MAATRAQLRIAMHRRAILDSFASKASNLGGEVWIAWNHAPEFTAASPTLVRLATALAVPPETLAEIVAEAEAIPAL